MISLIRPDMTLWTIGARSLRWFRGLLIAIACLAFPGVAVAADGDLQIGSYQGKWCNYNAIFSIDSKVNGKWVFHGTLTLPATHQSDRLWIEQYDDDSLLMIRYLSGGAVQRIETGKPRNAGDKGLSYQSTRSDGPGCQGTRTTLYTAASNLF